MKTLVIRFSSLGDCILLCPLLAHLKRTGCEEVTVVTKRAYAELFACADGADHVVAFDASLGLGGLSRIARDHRDRGYAVIDAHNNWRSRFLAWRLGGARARIARFDKHYSARLGLIVFKRSAALPTILEGYARLAPDSSPPALSPGGITVPEAARERVARSWNGADRAVAVAPGSRWPAKRWGAERYLDLARTLADDHGYRVVLVGDRDDAAVTRAIAAELGDARAIDVAGKTTLMESAAWIERCDGFVGNDSGLMHLAEAVGVPAVGLFGPTVREFGYAPALAASKTVERDLPCRPCSRNGAAPCVRGTNECLAAIEPSDVAPVVLDMLHGRGEKRAVLK